MIELVLVVGIILMLSTAAVPSFRNAVEVTRVERGVSELQSMWIAQRLHYLETGRFAQSLKELEKANLLPSSSFGATPGFEFKIHPSYRGNIQLKAKRVDDSNWSGEIYLDKNAILHGEITAKRGDVVKP